MTYISVLIDIIKSYMKNAILMSHHKYGNIVNNFIDGSISPEYGIKNFILRFNKYLRTLNKEYLIDALNFLAFDYSIMFTKTLLSSPSRPTFDHEIWHLAVPPSFFNNITSHKHNIKSLYKSYLKTSSKTTLFHLRDALVYTYINGSGAHIGTDGTDSVVS